MASSKSRQIVGNAGLFYVCYRLSLIGWNAMPTTRNAKGVDVVAYDPNASRTVTLQVKSLSQRMDVPLGEKLDNPLAPIFSRKARKNRAGEGRKEKVDSAALAAKWEITSDTSQPLLRSPFYSLLSKKVLDCFCVRKAERL
jgi:hypothetical protein